VLRIVERSKASVFVVAQSWLGMDYSPTIASVLEGNTDVEKVVVVSGDGDPAHDRMRSFDELLGGLPMAERDCAEDPNAPSLIAFTGGVTGEPKGIVHSQNTMSAATAGMVAAFGARGATTLA
jgi:cyclohexanecarboxylate-CoA ligase